MATNMTSLLAASGRIASNCSNQMDAFRKCKAENSDPERCIEEGSAVISCTHQTTTQLAQAPHADAYAAFVQCLEDKGELAKCADFKAALEATY